MNDYKLTIGDEEVSVATSHLKPKLEYGEEMPVEEYLSKEHFAQLTKKLSQLTQGLETAGFIAPAIPTMPPVELPQNFNWVNAIVPIVPIMASLFTPLFGGGKK